MLEADIVAEAGMGSIGRQGGLGWAAMAAVLVACQPPGVSDTNPNGAIAPLEPSADAIAKISFDLDMLNADGLYGPPDGLRALDYEFCLPLTKPELDAAQTIDPSLQLYPASAGRIGCTADQVLAIGNTHQANHRLILLELANLPYIERIDPVYWE